MNPKRQIQLAHRLLTLNYLLLETLDELAPSTAEIKEYIDNLTKLSELMNESVADTDAVLRTTYFQEMANKVDTIIRKNLNENM